MQTNTYRKRSGQTPPTYQGALHCRLPLSVQTKLRALSSAATVAEFEDNHELMHLKISVQRRL